MRERDLDLWKPRNSITQRKTRREVLRWITIPFAIIAIIILVSSVLAWWLPSAPASVLADISLIWLLFPATLAALLFTLITAGSAYLVIKAIQVLPPYFYQAQNYARLISVRVDQIGNKIIAPIIKVNKFGARARAARRETGGVARRVVGRD